MLNLNFSPFPELFTERLKLRQLTPADTEEIFMLRSNEAVNKFIDRPKTNTIEDASQFILKINNGIANNEWVYWVINLTGEPKLAGTIGYWNIEGDNLSAEIGYELVPGFQGKGIMQEAMESVLSFGFQHIGLQKVMAFSHVDNNNSVRLLERNKFSRDEITEQEPLPELNNYAIYTLFKKKFTPLKKV